MNVAILDDYQNVALECADWSRLQSGHEIEVFQDHIPDADQEALIARLRPFDIVCIMRERTRLPLAVIERLPNLKLIVVTGGGSSVIDIVAASERGVLVCGAPGSGHGPQEHVFALILALARGIVQEHNSVRSGGWQLSVGRELGGAVLGIVGLGRLGSVVAQYGRAFGMDVVAWSENLTEARTAECGAELVSKETLFKRADFVAITITLSSRTIGLVGTHELNLMKSDAYLINVSRGPIVDSDALLSALKDRRIAGAALDVFDEEPLPADHPFRTADRLLLTPHIGYVTRETCRKFYGGQVAAILAFLEGKPINVLDKRHQVHRAI
jgi:phosphoglycerate dehydrogenase-like enzyme